jgi:hypothetical protein
MDVIFDANTVGLWYSKEVKPLSCNVQSAPPSSLCYNIFRSLLRRKRNVIDQLPHSLRVPLDRLKLHHQALLHRKHRIVLEVRVLAVEDLGRDGLVAVALDLFALLASGRHPSLPSILSLFRGEEEGKPRCGSALDTYNQMDMRRPKRMSI